ncbi:MAG TPA: hypothetical protein VM577_07420, partial [Anaerovoracaceae bacterium]|nr:hypothetical protein [Anaerovoracaceae bacterium]
RMGLDHKEKNGYLYTNLTSARIYYLSSACLIIAKMEKYPSAKLCAGKEERIKGKSFGIGKLTLCNAYNTLNRDILN